MDLIPNVKLWDAQNSPDCCSDGMGHPWPFPLFFSSPLPPFAPPPPLPPAPRRHCLRLTSEGRGGPFCQVCQASRSSRGRQVAAHQEALMKMRRRGPDSFGSCCIGAMLISCREKGSDGSPKILTIHPISLCRWQWKKETKTGRGKRREGGEWMVEISQKSHKETWSLSSKVSHTPYATVKLTSWQRSCWWDFWMEHLKIRRMCVSNWSHLPPLLQTPGKTKWAFNTQEK